MLRSALLFLISVVLVLGFWFHAEFYQLGLYPILVIGGAVTFLVILAMRAVLAGTLPARRPRQDFVLSASEAEGIERRSVGAAIARATPDLPLVGTTVRMVTPVGASYGAARVVDAYRRLLGDLSLEDLHRASHPDLASFRKAWEARHPWRPEELVTVLLLSAIRRRAE